MPWPFFYNLRWCVITYNDCTPSSFRFQYQLFSMTTFFEIAVYLKLPYNKNMKFIHISQFAKVSRYANTCVVQVPSICNKQISGKFHLQVQV